MPPPTGGVGALIDSKFVRSNREKKNGVSVVLRGEGGENARRIMRWCLGGVGHS
jgi:hypothetical protein